MKNYPEAIISNIAMLDVNYKLNIYSGAFELESTELENNINVEGKIQFSWLPNIGGIFYGKILEENIIALTALNKLNGFNLLINGLNCGIGLITSITTTSDTSSTGIKGIIRKLTIGDRSINVNKVKFSIPNFVEFFGDSIKYKQPKGILKISKGRLIFHNEDVTITFDKVSDYNKKNESLKEQGGFMVLYNGELVSKTPMTYKEICEYLDSFSTFLNFLNGNRTSALFRQAIFENDILWEDYSAYNVAQYQDCVSWMPIFNVKGLNSIWIQFQNIWKIEANKDFLTSLVHWYIEANNHKGFVEGSIIMAQTALELIFNWWIVENKKIIIGRDSENISASNKIRLVISQLNISTEIPIKYKELKNFVKKEQSLLDSCDTIVFIRNAIVHSQEEKRKKLQNIEFKIKYQSLQLSLWYIELSLLKILKYKGSYFNRASSNRSKGNAIEEVPWN